MQITQVTVTAARVIPHPVESYSNLRPSVSLTATLSPEDEPFKCVRNLQNAAEVLVVEHANNMVKAIVDEAARARREGELKAVRDMISQCETSLNDPDCRDHGRIQSNLAAYRQQLARLEAGKDRYDDDVPF